EMRRHPVDDNADAALMQKIYKIRKILRGTKALRRRKKARNLITPGSVERVFRQWHEYDMRKTHIAHILGQHGRESPIAERPASIRKLTFPRREVSLVNRERPVGFPVAGAALLQPGVILPHVSPHITNDRGIAGRCLEISTIGVRLHPDPA